MIELNNEQAAALEAIEKWLKPEDVEQFFVLSGSAGTGKTTLVRQLSDKMRGRLVFTAPTNKATRVLRQAVSTPNYKPECRTIYSLLGLRLEANGEVKELTAPEDPIDLSQYRCVVVDEGSMVNENLRQHIKSAATLFNVKFLFLGDPAQLPPVGEVKSPIWRVKHGASLVKVMRHDNQILALATRLREQVDAPSPTIKIVNDHEADEGVWSLYPYELIERVRDEAQAGNLSRPDASKVIAWRNVTVDKYNRLTRGTIFGAEAVQPWLAGDRVIFTAPAKDLADEQIAATDDEGLVERVTEAWHPEYSDFKVHNVTVTLDNNRVAVARVLHPEFEGPYKRRCEQYAEAAKLDKRKWRFFWDFKESFHSLRHAYAITAHRAQGSTYDTALVDMRDILLNQTRREAFQCLYVACTRPKKRLFVG